MVPRLSFSLIFQLELEWENVDLRAVLEKITPYIKHSKHASARRS